MVSISYPAAIFLGIFFQAISGFGSGLVASPILAIFHDPKRVVLVISIPLFVSAIYNFFEIRKNVPWSRVRAYGIWVLLGVPVGTWVLGGFPAWSLKFLMALMLGSTVLPNAGKNIPGFRHWLCTPINGIITGIVTGAVGAPGASLVPWAYSQDTDFNTKRSIIITVIVIAQSFRMITYSMSGLYNQGSDFWWDAMLCLPAGALATLCGALFLKRMSEKSILNFIRSSVALLAAIMMFEALRSAMDFWR